MGRQEHVSETATGGLRVGALLGAVDVGALFLLNGFLTGSLHTTRLTSCKRAVLFILVQSQNCMHSSRRFHHLRLFCTCLLSPLLPPCPKATPICFLSMWFL